METAVCKTSAEKIQDQGLNLELKAEGFSFSDSSFSTSTSSVKSENLEINLKGKTNLSVSGLIKVDSEKGTSCESPKTVESPQKSLSPTLIEHAFKVMKNLFSPDKNRSKPANIPSPITHRSASGSPVNSVYIPNKVEFCTSESGIEIKNIVQSAENSLKGDSSLTHLSIMHNSFTLDPLNNTNDSFFTTTSLIDESFQSAITHLDENADTLKNNENKESFLNDSRGLDSLEPLSDTLENSELCLENTILMNDSVSSDRAKPDSVFGDGIKRNSISQECVQATSSNSNDKNFSNGLSKTSLNVSSEKNLENLSFESQQPDFSGAEGEREEDELNREEKIEVSMLNFNEAEEPSQNTEIISSDESHGENLSSCKLSNESFSNRSEEEKKENSNEQEMQISEEIIGGDGELCEDRESFVEKSISTTTVILNAMDSVDIDNMLLSLREDDSGTNTSSLTSVEGNDDNGSLDHDLNREPDSASTDVVSTNLNGDRPENSFGNDFLSKRPSGRVTSKSEENSPNKSINARKNKLNKSIDFVRRRSRSKSPEGKKAPREKLGSRSSGGIFTSEAPEHFSDFNPPMDALNIASEVRTTLSSPSLNTERNKVDEAIENSSNLDMEKNNATPDEPDSVSVVSQQSYTILIAGDNNLNRPVINSSENLSNGSSKNFVPDEEISNAPSEDKVDEIENNYLSVSTENMNLLATSKSSALTYEVKSNSKFLKSAQNGSTQTFVKRGSLTLYPQEVKESSSGDKGGDFNELPDFQSKPELDGEPPELSPVPPFGNQAIFSNEMNQGVDKKLKSSTPNKPLQKKTESPAPIKLNQTYEKKAESPAPSKMNQTFDKKQETPVQNKLNQTYDKKTETTPTVKLNKTYEKKSECSLGNPSQSESPIPHKFNETFDKKPESPSILSQTFEIIEAGGQDEKNKTFEIKNSPLAGNSLDKTFEKDQKLGGVIEPLILSRISEGIVQSTMVRSPETRLASIAENFVEKTNEGMELGVVKDTLDASFISTTSSNASLLCNANSTVVFNQGSMRGTQIDNLSAKLQEMKLLESGKKEREIGRWIAGLMPPPQSKKEPFKDQTIFIEHKFLPNVKEEKLHCDAELAQLIQEQFSSTDIEKICSVVDDLSFLRLSDQNANEQFESLSATEFNPLEFKCAALTPQSFDFLNSIKGKPTGRDLSRESLYVKFDPLVQAPNANSLIDFTKEVEALAAFEAAPETEPPGASVCEQLLAISPEKKPDDIVPPLTPLSHKKKEDKAERLKELQNEIYFFRNLYAEREKFNKAKMEEFESQVAILTGQNCILEDKLKESNEREKSLVKKLKEETQSVNQLKAVMEEYVKMITKLTVELQELKLENAKQVEALVSEKDSYITHLQNTEAAFTDVHAKYEKSKKTILNLKANEAAYKSTIAEKTRLLENFRGKAKEAQEVTFNAFQKLQEELSETKAEHRQETARLKALLRKTELKLEAMHESLDHKIKENEQLTAICDELIEGKK